MTGLAGVLALHQYEFEHQWYCTCGAELVAPNDAAMALHQAEMVTAAGLVVVTQEPV